MKTRAKFVVKSIEQHQWQQYRDGKNEDVVVHTYRLVPVTGGSTASPENKSFWNATPDGEIRLGSVHAQDWKLGQELYIDFTPTEVAVAAA